MKKLFKFCTPLFAIYAVFISTNMSADEGMWLFNALPIKQIEEKYHFNIPQEWVDHIQKSSVRFNNGGSGSFISGDGLAITNHHVGSPALVQFSTPEHNYLRDGFYAKTLQDEKKCFDLELNVLQSIEDVTASVNSVLKPDMSTEQSLAARRGIIAQIEQESLKTTGLRSDVVTLFGGGSYQLYRYKKYTDVRLVFAPEQKIAFFGGDPSNFEYPRYDYDICIFRAYENNAPAQIKDYLKFNVNGPTEHELVFTSGHPGATARDHTLAEFSSDRDNFLPTILRILNRREVYLSSYSERSNDNEIKARDELFGIQNARKVFVNRLAGLLDPAFWSILVNRENKLRNDLSEKPELKRTLDAFEKIEKAEAIITNNSRLFIYLEGAFRRPPAGLNSRDFVIARQLIRSIDQRAKPNEVRLPEYRESNKASFELGLFSKEPLYDDFEELKLTDSLTDLAGTLGYENPIVQTILAGKAPDARAAELIKGTKVKDPNVRKEIYDGGAAALEKYKNDPMIQLARTIDDTALAARKINDEQDEVKKQGYAEIQKAKLQLANDTTAPDATFTLRLSFGSIEGYTENGKKIPPFTNFAGLFQTAIEHNNTPPFDLPPRWLQSKSKLNLNTNFNFLSTNDSVGGSSGSPVINKNGEFVGILFDGNLESIRWDYAFDDKTGRSISVDSSAIIEGLDKVYGVTALVNEIKTGKRSDLVRKK